MYLPKSQYCLKSIEELGTFNLKVSGREQDKNKIERIKNTLFNQTTKVVVTSFGAIYSTLGVNLEKGDFSNATELISEDTTTSQPTLNTPDNSGRSSKNRLKSIKLPPTSKDRNNGVMRRYFYKNRATGNCKELNRAQYINNINSRSKRDKIAAIEWYIKGPVKDQMINGYFLEGIESKNLKSIELLKKELPGAEKLLLDPLEYVKNENIVEATPILDQDKDITIPSPGKRL